MLEKIVFPYINYKGEYSIRCATPCDIVHEDDNEYHGSAFIMKAVDHDKNAIRDFCLEDMLKAAYHTGYVHGYANLDEDYDSIFEEEIV